ncbi:MAG: EAL domain-containing protein [Methylococcaceae bacterium]
MLRLILLFGFLAFYSIATATHEFPFPNPKISDSNTLHVDVPQPKRRVLVIYSFHDTLPWQAKIREALFAQLNAIPPAQRPELFEERFEAHRLTPLISNENFLALLEAKYNNVKLDLLITENDYAFDFIKNTPNFLPNVKRKALTLTRGRDDDALVVNERADLSIDTILKVLPNTKRIISVIENSAYNYNNVTHDTLKKMQAALNAKNVQLDIWDNFSYEELYEQAARLPKKDTVLFGFPMTVDRLGVNQVPRDVIQHLSDVASVPVFVHHDSFFGFGAVGGYVISATKVGDLLARMVLGLDVPKTRTEIDAATKGNYFDDNELKRWGIPDENLPADSVIFNREESIFYAYRWQILGTLFVFMLESLLVVALFRSLRQRNQATLALAQERDLLEYHVAERTHELAESRNLFQEAAKVAKFGVFDYDLITGELNWDDSMFEIYGVKRGEFANTYNAWYELLLPEDSSSVKTALESAIRGESEFNTDFRIQRSQGDYATIYALGQVYRDSTGKAIRIVCFNQDITERKAAEKRINSLAFYDPLTNLPNRRLLGERLSHAIDLATRENKMFAVLMLDLDHFKEVNDGFGHLAGDELLVQVAQRISSRLRTVDTVARLGGDEFTIVLNHVHHIKDAGEVANAIIHDLVQPFHLSVCDDIHIGTSIGISLYPQHADSAEKLMDYSDMALYQAKKSGRGRFAYFSEELTILVQDRIALEMRLRKAIEQQEFQVFYQPQVEISTGKIIGAEALVRWIDPQQGLISPIHFIPLAEETGLIMAIGEFVLYETCRQGKKWLDAEFEPIILAVNVSPYQFCHSDIAKLVSSTLAKTEFPATQLELEMTESGLMENQENVINLLENLRKQGIHLAIDDFGTGYSSLSYLKKFPVDILKIDKSFIDGIPYDQSDNEIATTIISMGHILGFKVLAEGVENREQLDFLHAKGCDIYQGYLKSKPLPADKFEQLLLQTNS